jgi:hypothetical protein
MNSFRVVIYIRGRRDGLLDLILEQVSYWRNLDNHIRGNRIRQFPGVYNVQEEGTALVVTVEPKKLNAVLVYFDFADAFINP